MTDIQRFISQYEQRADAYAKKAYAFIKAFAMMRVKCPDCKSDQVQLLNRVAWIAGSDIDKENPPKYARCRCRMCRLKFMTEMK